MKLSVICVYNNAEQYEKQLVASLNNQNIEHELVGIDNTKNQFSSAAAALNYGVNKSIGEILVFSHQDIYLKGQNELRQFGETIASLEIGTVVGTQGAKYPGKQHISNITSGQLFDEQMQNDYPDILYSVDCVDEGLFGMKRETWSNHPFDEILCDNWHLYCVEACLNARETGHLVYVNPINLHHFSKGTITISYMDGMKRLCKKYRRQKYIWTTCYKVYTSQIYMDFLVLIWKMNRIIHHRLLDA